MMALDCDGLQWLISAVLMELLCSHIPKNYRNVKRRCPKMAIHFPYLRWQFNFTILHLYISVDACSIDLIIVARKLCNKLVKLMVRLQGVTKCSCVIMRKPKEFEIMLRATADYDTLYDTHRKWSLHGPSPILITYNGYRKWPSPS